MSHLAPLILANGTIPATESDEVIKSSVENLVPIPSEFEGISDDTSDVPNCDNNRVNVEIDFVESLINRDTSIDYSSKIDPIFEEFAGELAHIAPIPPGIVEADFDPNDDTSSDDDDFEDVEYVSFEEVNDVEQEEKEFDLEDILQIQDVILREKLLKISRLITNIESLKDNPNPISVTDNDSSDTSLSFSNNSLSEFESFSDHTEETRSDSTTTHANYSIPEYESFHFDNPSLPRPLPEPPDVCLDMLYNDESFEPGEGENIIVSNVEKDDSFTFTIRTFLPFLTYPEDRTNKFFEASRVRLICPVLLELLILCVKLVWGDPISFHHYRLTFIFAYFINGLDFRRDPTLNIEDNVSFEQIRHDEEIVLARARTSTLEILIEDIQVRHRSDMKSLLDKIRELKNHKGGPPDY
ncbi:hypothetical protein Tco_0530627 [Tanacetum coccineum]